MQMSLYFRNLWQPVSITIAAHTMQQCIKKKTFSTCTRSVTDYNCQCSRESCGKNAISISLLCFNLSCHEIALLQAVNGLYH